MKVRGIRGAVSVAHNTAPEIRVATRKLLEEIVRVNSVAVEDIASIFFTVTRDLDAQFPAEAARELGWTYVPLMCANEIDVAGSLPRIVRVLLHVNTDRLQHEIKHVYLGEARALRPDL